MNEQIITSFDKKKYEDLEKSYNEAIKENKIQFIFEGQTLLVAYAKYLLEYLKPLLYGSKN